MAELVVVLVLVLVSELVLGVEVLVLVLVFDVLELLLLLPPPAGFTTVVLFSVFLSAGGVTVSDFCSHAARSAAPARMQIYFFIVFECSCPSWVTA